MDKKKRMRPTLGQTRALENELAEWKRIAELREKDLIASHAECNTLYAKLEFQTETTNRLMTGYDSLQAENRKLSAENDTLEKSNILMEQELQRVRNANKSLNELNGERLAKIQQLRSRGFWDRVFNRKQ